MCATDARVFSGSRVRKLAKAVIRDDAARVRHLIAKGVYPDAVGTDGTTLLYLAMDCDSRSAFTALLDSGADPDLRDPEELTALHYAVKKCDPWFTETLLKYGADPDAVDSEGWGAPLIDAAIDPEQVRALLAAGADPNPSDEIGNTALHYSATYQEYGACWICSTRELIRTRRTLTERRLRRTCGLISPRNGKIPKSVAA